MAVAVLEALSAHIHHGLPGNELQALEQRLEFQLATLPGLLPRPCGPYTAQHVR